MSSSSFPIDTNTILVADASVIINLNATGRALDIIIALQGSVVVTDNAFAELVAGTHNGHSDDKKLQVLVDSGTVQLVELGEVGNLVYSSLVEGTASCTLDDGEAATIG
jgi:predicted nucleic acid-binding protein